MTLMWYAWTRLALASAQAWQEAQTVMVLRALRLARGGALAQREMQHMLFEKGVAHTEAMMTLATGGSMHKVVRRYRSQVRANKRRLTR